MQSIVPDIFDNHSLAPNIKHRESRLRLLREINGSAAYTRTWLRRYERCLWWRSTQIWIRYKSQKAANNMGENRNTVVGPYSKITRMKIRWQMLIMFLNEHKTHRNI